MGSELFWIDDAQMGRLRPLSPNKTRGKKRVDDRRVISGIVHVLHLRYWKIDLKLLQ